ncbi:Wzz/FepE/Etk N-terminal domain-containing protein [Kushneria phyllosphaerae]|uniref:Ferric enterobactin transport protein FepE n=1 Tax=Kushneria phyllosphaerae TaxID=2100822 RepID=A0A2R8CNB6_9GAMM|nr:Wzz/FepE/Etk N-terminal domain-containing protein [Kushneria phyllosphaerae]SPJ34380.1 Ferric enterobactin transport protein FepE [Kushneria phyllosphaerae]
MAGKEETNNLESNEIDLVELFRTILRGWKIIFVSLVFFTCAGLLYAFLKTPVYQSSTRIITADSANLAALNQFQSPWQVMGNDLIKPNNIGQYENYNVSPDYAHYRFKERVGSSQNFQKFAIESDLKLQNTNSIFSNSFDFSESKSGDYSSLTISYRYADDTQGANLLNNYVAWTAGQVRNELVDNFVQFNDLKINELESKRSLLKEKLISEREARIFELEQAIQTARLLNIKEPTVPQELGRQRGSNQGLYAGVQGNDWQLPLYFMGVNVLGAEKEIIQQQLDKGLSSEEIRDLGQKITERQRVDRSYKEISGESKERQLAGIKVINIVDAAYRPAEPIEPNKRMILFLAICIGGMAGVLAVIVRRSIRLNKS